MLIRQTYALDIEVEMAERPVGDGGILIAAFSEATGYRAPTWAEMIRGLREDPIEGRS